MRGPVLRTTLTLLSLAFPVSPASAWNQAGHMVSGAIAFDVLKAESPQTLAAVVAILKRHPQYATLWEAKLGGLPEKDRNRYLFMLAARWADDIRGHKKYDHPFWHFINYPFKPAGQPDSVKPAPPREENIVQAFGLNLKKLRQGAREDQAVALCWLFHLVGDVHQPLHVAALFTTHYPSGDKGGNLIFVRVKEGGRPITLHYFWDGLILGSPRFRMAGNVATKLRARPEFARAKLAELKETAFAKWAASESLALAREVAYLDGKLQGSALAETARVLPDGYARKAKAVTERRIVLAGYRLADLLKQVLK